MRTGSRSSSEFQRGSERPRLPAAPTRFVLTFRTLAKAKRAWELLVLLNAMKVFPDDVWINYSSSRPREIVFGTGEKPTMPVTP
jgi:hypothetical protein